MNIVEELDKIARGEVHKVDLQHIASTAQQKIITDNIWLDLLHQALMEDMFTQKWVYYAYREYKKRK